MALKSIFKDFKSVYDEIKDKEISPDFIAERKIIVTEVRKAKKQKLKMTMNHTAFNKQFTI